MAADLGWPAHSCSHAPRGGGALQLRDPSSWQAPPLLGMPSCPGCCRGVAACHWATSPAAQPGTGVVAAGPSGHSWRGLGGCVSGSNHSYGEGAEAPNQMATRRRPGRGCTAGGPAGRGAAAAATPPRPAPSSGVAAGSCYNLGLPAGLCGAGLGPCSMGCRSGSRSPLPAQRCTARRWSRPAPPQGVTEGSRRWCRWCRWCRRRWLVGV